MDSQDSLSAEQAAIRSLLTSWAAAVRAKDLPAVLAHHAENISMFDVPPPFESRGIEAYEATWALFYSAQPEPMAFDIKRVDIVAGHDVAFAYALMQCAEIAPDAGTSCTSITRFPPRSRPCRNSLSLAVLGP